MPTPMRVYAELAARFGGVDPKDEEAVDRFFEAGVYELPSDVQKKIADAITAGENTRE